MTPVSELRVGLREWRWACLRRPRRAAGMLLPMMAAAWERWRRPRPPSEVPPGVDAGTVPALPAPAAPVASIVIPVFNQAGLTLGCLQSIARAGARQPFEVIVVDDASTDRRLEPLRAAPGLTWLRNERNLGFVGSCNAGAARARGSVLVFLNNDTRVLPGWLDRMLETLRAPGVGLVGARLQYPDGRLQEAGGLVFADGSAANYGRFAHPQDPRYRYRRDADYCSGAAIAIGRELFQRLGGFDGRYAPAYYEDTDLAMAVRAAGSRVVYEPLATVEHLEGASAGTDLSVGMKAHQRINAGRFAEKWGAVLVAQHAASGTDPDVAIRRRARARLVVACGAGEGQAAAIGSWLTALAEDGCAVDLHLLRAWQPAHLDALRASGICVWPPHWLRGARWHWLRTAEAAHVLVDDGSVAARRWTAARMRDVPGVGRWSLRLQATGEMDCIDVADGRCLGDGRQALGLTDVAAQDRR